MVLRRNVLIFHAGALGDFVLNWPLALAAGRLFPQSRVFYITHAEKGKLAERVLGVESADIEAGWHHLYSDPAQLPERAVKLLAGAHTIFAFTCAAGDACDANLRRIAPHATIATLHPTPRERFEGHATEDLLSQLSAWPVVRTAVEQMLRSIADRGVGPGRASGAQAVLIHPGSGGREKCWPLEQFAALAGRLLEQGRCVRVLLGEVERERMGAGELGCFPSAAEIRRPPTCVELAEELLGGSALVCNDSGPGHLAGVLGVPVLSLFGPTDPRLWRPMGPRGQVLRHQPFSQLTVDEVWGALGELLSRTLCQNGTHEGDDGE
jgi:ADP-heptose:LPS heptosyltransferase